MRPIIRLVLIRLSKALCVNRLTQRKNKLPNTKKASDTEQLLINIKTAKPTNKSFKRGRGGGILQYY